MRCDAVLWELTWRCDRDCEYCYNVWRHDRDYPRVDLPRSEIGSFADRILERFSPRTVTLIGGEPTLHEGCVDAVRHLTSRGVAVAMSTHGGLVDAELARSLARAGLRAAEVSLNPEHLAAACRAIALLDEQGVECTASIVLARPVLEHLGELIARAAAFGAVGLSIHPLIEPFPGALPDRLVPDDEEFVAALEEIAAQTRLPARLSYPPGANRVPVSAAELVANCCACDGSRRVVDAAGNVRWCEASVGGSPGRRGCGLVARRS